MKVAILCEKKADAVCVHKRLKTYGYFCGKAPRSNDYPFYVIFDEVTRGVMSGRKNPPDDADIIPLETFKRVYG